MRAARGDVVAFTDDDCLVDSQWVARIDAEFRADVELGIVGGRVELHDPGDAPVSVRVHRERVLVQSFPDIAAFMIGCNCPAAGACSMRSATSTPGWERARVRRRREDWDFLYRSHKAGAKIVFSPDVLVFHDHGRRSEAQVESLKRGYVIGRWAFYCKHAARFDRRSRPSRRVTSRSWWRILCAGGGGSARSRPWRSA